MTTQTDTRGLIRQYYTGTLDELIDMTEEFIAEDFRLVDPIVGEIRGREDLEDYYREMAEGFSDGRIDADDVIVEGDRVAVRWTVSGTHDGTMMGVEPTGKEITISGVDVDRVEDGRIVEMLTYYDGLGFMNQLGVIDADEELPPAA